MTTVERTFKGSAHTGYIVTNGFGAVATVTERPGGHIVRTETDLYLVRGPGSLIEARDIAIAQVAI